MATAPKLCEIIAIVGGKKSDAEAAVTEIYHKLQKKDLFDGLTRTYQSKIDGDEVLPGETKYPQLKVKDLINDACGIWAELYDLTLTLDTGNCQAVSDIVVDEAVVAEKVPVTTLLFLQKQLEHIKTFISKMPTPDLAEKWAFDNTHDCYSNGGKKSVRTKKVSRPVVMYEATKEHPAQVQMVTEDIPTGEWTQTNFTTRIPTSEQNQMLERVGKLIDAVKIARERANVTPVEKKKMSDRVLGYVFGDSYTRKK